MSILSYHELCELVEQGAIDAPLANVNGSSIDLTLGTEFYEECAGAPYFTVDLLQPDTSMRRIRGIGANSQITIAPGEFILAQAAETFNLPLDISASFMLKSSQGRAGLGHQLAGWIDAGFQGKITLEFMNVKRYHNIILKPGQKCGQVVFHRHAPVPYEHSYKARGQYQNDGVTMPSKGMK